MAKPIELTNVPIKERCSSHSINFSGSFIATLYASSRIKLTILKSLSSTSSKFINLFTISINYSIGYYLLVSTFLFY